MNANITTVGQAQALAETTRSILAGSWVETLANGMSVQRRGPPDLCIHAWKPDDILMFEDVDGRGMEVVYTNQAPRKVPITF